MDNIIP